MSLMVIRVRLYLCCRKRVCIPATRLSIASFKGARAVSRPTSKLPSHDLHGKRPPNTTEGWLLLDMHYSPRPRGGNTKTSQLSDLMACAAGSTFPYSVRIHSREATSPKLILLPFLCAPWQQICGKLTAHWCKSTSSPSQALAIKSNGNKIIRMSLLTLRTEDQWTLKGPFVTHFTAHLSNLLCNISELILDDGCSWSL